MKRRFNGRSAVGKTKDIVLEASKLGLTFQQVIRNSGKSYASIYNACYKLGIKLKNEKKRNPYGFVKQTILNAKSSGISAIELSQYTGIDINTIYVSASRYKVSLNKYDKTND